MTDIATEDEKSGQRPELQVCAMCQRERSLHYSPLEHRCPEGAALDGKQYGRLHSEGRELYRQCHHVGTAADCQRAIRLILYVSQRDPGRTSRARTS
jgi:hypothetical protein